MPANAKPGQATKVGGRAFAPGAAVLGLAIGSVFYFFDPAQFGFYPACLFHKLTGLNCPGCGGLRALHQLLHGHLAAAFQLNPLLVLALPLALWFLARQIFDRGAGKLTLATFTRPPWPWILLGVVVLFGVMRNLPLPLFANLSP